MPTFLAHIEHQSLFGAYAGQRADGNVPSAVGIDLGSQQGLKNDEKYLIGKFY